MTACIRKVILNYMFIRFELKQCFLLLLLVSTKHTSDMWFSCGDYLLTLRVVRLLSLLICSPRPK